MRKFFSDFKKFISRGNILDMAVGVIVGGAFNAIVTAFTNQIIMPLINWLLSVISGGQNGLEGAVTVLKWAEDGTLENSIYINWGAFISAILNFLIIAMTLFIILKVAMKSSEMFKHATESTMRGRLTKEEKAELKALGINKKDKEAVKAYREEKAQKLAEAKAEEEAKQKALEEEKYHNSTEYLLKEILAVLKEKENPKEELKKALNKTRK